MSHRAPKAVSVQDATRQAPTLARLIERASQSSQLLKSVESVIPEALRTAIQAGPLEAGQWCLIVNNSATAAKLKHLLPTVQAALLAAGAPVSAIRLKVLSAPSLSR